MGTRNHSIRLQARIIEDSSFQWNKGNSSPIFSKNLINLEIETLLEKKAIEK
jgi:hypothetical protein